MRTILPLLLLPLLACGTKGDDPFGQGGGDNNMGVPTGDGGATGDGGSTTDDTGTGSDGGTTDGGTTDGGTTDDTGTGPVIKGTGYDAGDTAYDLVATDQAGSPFRLHSLYGRNVVLVVGHMDDPAFTNMTTWLGAVEDATVVALVGRDEDGVTADTADALGWASAWGVSTVLVDPTGELVNTWAERAPPKTYVIGASMDIAWTWFGTASQVQVQDKIDDL
ncbi:hypothetical protein L6R53_02070 [Myxococcota bacterium]|nr:hypothetical protein [Myxococcota bacterium]